VGFTDTARGLPLTEVHLLLEEVDRTPHRKRKPTHCCVLC